jgi:hypothetical protein
MSLEYRKESGMATKKGGKGGGGANPRPWPPRKTGAKKGGTKNAAKKR